jgi:hypothetical protein
MARAGSKPTTPDQRVRDLRKELRGFDREDPGPERASRLADFARAAHGDRQLNMSMHAATLCLAEDPDAPELLVAAYGTDDEPEDRLSALNDLRELARYIERPDVVTIADALLLETARAWVVAAEDGERRYRLRTVQSLTSREVADGLRDELEYRS